MTRIIIQHSDDLDTLTALRRVRVVVAYRLPTPDVSIDNIEVIRRPARPDVAAQSYIVRRVPPIAD